MLTVEDFVFAGYKRFNQVKHVRDHAAFGLQKRFDDELGKRYFITVFVYDNRNVKASGRMPESLPDFSFEPDCQFNEKGDFCTSNVQLIPDNDSTIEKIEKQFEIIWKVLGSPYYEYWD